MNTNIKFKRVKAYRLLQEKLRNKALAKGVNLIAPDTIRNVASRVAEAKTELMEGEFFEVVRYA